MIDYDGRPGHPPDRTVCGDRRPRCSTSGWTALVDHLRTRGYTDAQLLDAGVGLRTRRGTVVDRFRDRLMFPVRDPGGQRIVGFLGRALVESEDTPRYLNSPATALYRKGEERYGPRAEPARRALAGGAQAALRAYQLLAATCAWPTTAELPTGLDPAALTQQRGPDALRATLDTATTPLADFVVDERLARWTDRLRWVEGQLGAARDAAGLIATLPPDQIGRQRRCGHRRCRPGRATPAANRR